MHLFCNSEIIVAEKKHVPFTQRFIFNFTLKSAYKFCCSSYHEICLDCFDKTCWNRLMTLLVHFTPNAAIHLFRSSCFPLTDCNLHRSSYACLCPLKSLTRHFCLDNGLPRLFWATFKWIHHIHHHITRYWGPQWPSLVDLLLIFYLVIKIIL